MSYGRATTRNLSAAIKLGNTYKLQDDAAMEIAYDRVSRTWNAFQIDKEMKQLGFAAQGNSPYDALNNWIELNKDQ